MKKSPSVLILGLAVAAVAQAAAPTVQNFSVSSVLLGNATTFSYTVTDPDGDLDYVRFHVSGPGISGWQFLGDDDVNGSSATVNRTWTPTQAGRFTVRATAYDLTGATTADRIFDIIPYTQAVSPTTITSGQSVAYNDAGQLITTENTTTSSVTVLPGGSLFLWSANRVTLKPGFKATTGSTFWAAIYYNQNGYTDMEEATDSDGDGMPDAWEIDHGLNPFFNDAAQDPDGDGLTNLQEYQQGRNPHLSDSGGTLPSGSSLVIRLSGNQFYGISLPSGAISPVGAP